MALTIPGTVSRPDALRGRCYVPPSAVLLYDDRDALHPKDLRLVGYNSD